MDSLPVHTIHPRKAIWTPAANPGDGFKKVNIVLAEQTCGAHTELDWYTPLAQSFFADAAHQMLRVLHELGLVEVTDDLACIMGVAEFRRLRFVLRYVPAKPLRIKNVVPDADRVDFSGQSFHK